MEPVEAARGGRKRGESHAPSRDMPAACTTGHSLGGEPGTCPSFPEGPDGFISVNCL